MIKTTYSCDICEKEYKLNEGAGELKGVLVKMNDKLEKQNFAAQQNYCGECVEVILNFLIEFKKKYAENNNPSPVGEQSPENGSDTGVKQ